MDPHKLMANLLKETEKGEPHAVIDPVDGCLCTEGNRLKEIIKGALGKWEMITTASRKNHNGRNKWRKRTHT